MILIYSDISSSRLQYICQFIFKEQLSVTYSLTIDKEGFKNHDGPKINYSDSVIEKSTFTIRNHALLFEDDIKKQSIECFETDEYKAFFKTAGSDFPFDIFAASFYLLSRYEEYLPHGLDMYGRYAHENSLAHNEGFLNIPLVNFWIKDLAKALKTFFPELNFQFPDFKFLPTYDIDIAWSYKSKGLLRNVGGFLQSPSVNRIKVLIGLDKDPFDSYLFLDALHKKNKLAPVYFFLVATWGSVYDKNISPYARGMWQLIRRHAKKYTIGLHPSWKSNDQLAIVKKEKKILETAGNLSISASRQHYIKLSLPNTFENLIELGITDDYSMGYGSINGFRASVASPFYWYNLKTGKISALRLHPFCFMDANSFYEEKLNAAEAYAEMIYYLQACKKANGAFISIFHNNFLGTDKQFAGWKEMYEKFISQLL
ncbi:MAG: polysaccharide deacetylase family protein [Ferruginibacter sp.]